MNNDSERKQISVSSIQMNWIEKLQKRSVFSPYDIPSGEQFEVIDGEKSLRCVSLLCERISDMSSYVISLSVVDGGIEVVGDAIKIEFVRSYASQNKSATWIPARMITHMKEMTGARGMWVHVDGGQYETCYSEAELMVAYEKAISYGRR